MDAINSNPPTGKNKAISVWINPAVHVRVVARVEDLDMSVSEYLTRLAIKDMSTGGDFVIVPKSKQAIQ